MSTESSQRLISWEQEFLDRQILSGDSRWSVRCLRSTTSTMDEARVLAAAVEPEHPMLVLAREQSAGRGRQGRKWESTERSFLGTAILVSRAELSKLSGLSLAVGVSVARTLEHFGVTVKLKWPNDLLDDRGDKIAGILIESELRESGEIGILIGLGVNLAVAPGEVPQAAAVRGATIGIIEFASIFSQQLWNDWLIFQELGFLAFREEWTARAAHLGDVMTVDLGAAQRSGNLTEGVCEGVSETGALLLRVDGEIQPIVAGHVVPKR